MLRKLWGKDDRKEVRKLTSNCKRLMQTQDRQVKGITDIIFTVGKKETKAFTSENKADRAKGEFYFVRVTNDVGSKEKMIVLWKKLSSNKDEFISDIVLASTKPIHEHFSLGDKEYGYKLVVHILK